MRRAIAANPKVPARLLIGDDRVSGNPKLNNVVKGWKAARARWVVIADSNVLMPRDYIQRLMARWRADTGIVCAPPIGVAAARPSRPRSNARSSTPTRRAGNMPPRRVGYGFAQGKTMLWRRDVLEAGGGIEALGAEIAEDAAATKLVHRAGLRAHLVSQPFQQPLGRSALARRLGAAGALGAAAARHLPALFRARAVDDQPVHLSRPRRSRRRNRASTRRSPRPRRPRLVRRRGGAGARRRLAAGWSSAPPGSRAISLLPWLWIQGWNRDQFVWRGNVMSVDDDALATDGPGPFPPA